MKPLRSWIFVVAGVMAVAGSTPAAALQIDLHYDKKATGSPVVPGLNLAARYWESVLTNDVRVDINVTYQHLGDGVLAVTLNTISDPIPIRDLRTALQANSQTTLDTEALANFPALNANGALRVVVPGYLPGKDGIDPTTSRIAPDGVISEMVGMTTANARALGLPMKPQVDDADIIFSSSAAFDFDPRDGIDADKADFFNVAIHEIGHSLGFVSGLEDLDFFAGEEGPVDAIWWGYPMDMFRYSAAGDLNWRPGVEAYFSVDGGVTPLQNGYFSTGRFNGDGNQASHWKEFDLTKPCGAPLGVMNPDACAGVMGGVTGLDLAVFDAIGWNTNVDVTTYRMSTADIYGAAAPEPAAWALMLTGFGAIGATLRRRRFARA